MSGRSEPTPVALYAGVSSDRQDVDLSVAAQLRALRDYADKNVYAVVREYVDEAVSGRVDDRPEFNKMIDEARLALSGADHGCGRGITLRQRDIVRLTVMSRSAVAGGISRLTSADLIRIGDNNSDRFSGLVHVPDVDRLKDYALSEVQEKQVRPLLPSTTDR